MWDRARRALTAMLIVPMMLILPILVLVMWAFPDKDTSRAYDRY